MTRKCSTTVHVGIDVGKYQLDVHILERNLDFTVTNDVSGIRQLHSRLARYRLERVVMEATGRRETEVMLALAERQWPVVVCQPLTVRQYAAAKGLLAKTDKLDARLLADYAAVMKPEIRPIPVANRRRVKDLVARRRQLVSMKTMEKNRLDVMPRALHADLRLHIRQLDKQIDKLDRLIQTAIQNVDEWRERQALLISVPGVGPQVLATLLTDLPELGQLSNKQIAALVGLAPFNRDSGTWRGKRRIRGGRATVRTVLFLAMMSAIQHNPRFKRLYQRMLDNGKHKKVALVACMRKFITILNTMVKNNQRWNENYA